MNLDKIIIKGAREHNLKNISLEIPKNKLVVITGVSGSGKSTLAFDTIYSEGQRKYVESLSAYARQFLQMMNKPDVDSIDGLSPAISIEQKTTQKNPRSTVGTVTEIYDYLRVLFARIGVPYSPTTGLPIKSQSVSEITDLILSKNKPSEVNDCFEGFNRATFAFNQALDGMIFKPIAKVYKVLPSPVRNGASNSLENLSNLVTVPNNILQGDLKKAAVNSGRFLINTTVGILGLIDIADYLGLPDYEKEDYGQTLGTMGIGPGCYVVLPVLGPSTVRDTSGSFVNLLGGDVWYNVTVKNETQHFEDSHYYTTRVMNGVDFRAKNSSSIDNLEKNSIDFYASVKSLYLQDRQQKILNTKKVVDTQDDSDWEEIDTQ